MIVVDTSVLVAILKQEPDGAEFLAALQNASRKVIGTPTKFELMLVMARWSAEPAVEAASALLDALGIEVISWDEEMTAVATRAALAYAKGRHSAALNYGDCMAYAVAKSLDAPLLFKGDDFGKTDIRSAL